MKKWILIAAAGLALMAAFATRLPAQDTDAAALSAKVDTLMKNQEKMLLMLGEIKEELKIIKVRASRK